MPNSRDQTVPKSALTACADGSYARTAQYNNNELPRTPRTTTDSVTLSQQTLHLLSVNVHIDVSGRADSRERSEGVHVRI